MYGELGYLNLVRNIIKHGAKEVGRNGTTYTKVGAMLRFSLKNQKIPLLTNKEISLESMPKGIIMVYKWRYK